MLGLCVDGNLHISERYIFFEIERAVIHVDRALLSGFIYLSEIGFVDYIVLLPEDLALFAFVISV